MCVPHPFDSGRRCRQPLLPTPTSHHLGVTSLRHHARRASPRRTLVPASGSSLLWQPRYERGAAHRRLTTPPSYQGGHETGRDRYQNTYSADKSISPFPSFLLQFCPIFDFYLFCLCMGVDLRARAQAQLPPWRLIPTHTRANMAHIKQSG